MWPEEMLNDPDLWLRCYKTALAEWACDDWNSIKRVALEWVHKELGNLSPRDLFKLLHRFVEQGGRVAEVRERRPEYQHHEFHYDLVVAIEDRDIYFETVLVLGEPRPPYDPRIEVVSIHDA